MRIKSLNTVGDRMRRNESNPSNVNLLGYLNGFFKFTILAVTIFIFGSHESANPKIGNTKIEFNSSEFRKQMHSEAIMAMNTKMDLVDNLVYKFYEERQHMPAWTLNFKTNEAYNELLGLLTTANNYGLFSSMYSVDELSGLEMKMSNLSNDEEKLKLRVALEELATSSAFLFMINLAAGIIPDNSDSSIVELTENFPEYLNLKLQTKELKNGILNLQPKSERYTFLQNGLKNLLSREKLNKISYSAEDILSSNGLLEKMLLDQGLLNKSKVGDSVEIAASLKKFQSFHNISQTGNPDSNTLQLLGKSSIDKFNQIALNLDRLRKDELAGENYILVNIPEFMLYFYDSKGHRTEYIVVVGKRFSPTPLLTSYIERIVANPHWTVPTSIAVNEIIPKIQSDSTYLSRNGFKVLDKDANAINEAEMDWGSMNSSNFKYYIRQDNSEKNALGLIKFLFPNEHSVYLHDTPSKQYFKKDMRAFSHGCVRVENPEGLAQQLISEYCSPEESELSIDKVIKTGKQKDIKLQKSLSIHIKYYTCTADSLGNIYYHPDIYSYDQAAIGLFARNGQE